MTQSHRLILMVGLAALAVPAAAQTGAAGAAAAPEKRATPTAVAPAPTHLGLERAARLQQIAELQERRRKQVDRLDQAEANLRKAERTSAPTSRVVLDAHDEVTDLQKQVAETEDRIRILSTEEARRAALLLSPVNLQLKDATVRQAAQALSKAGQAEIQVDPAVPEDVRLTLDATGMPLARVLEVIAAKTVLMIAPSDEGVVLKRWPMLTVDGQTQVQVGPIAPWADEWETPPTAQFGLGGAAPPGAGGLGFGGGAPNFGGGAAGLGGGLPSAGPVPPSPYVQPFGGGFGPGAMGGGFGSMAELEAALCMASLGDRIVVLAEPAPGPRGEPGVWLTVYRLDGFVLKKVSATFHPASGPGAMGPGAMPGMGIGAPYPPGAGGFPGAASPSPAVPPGANKPAPAPGGRSPNRRSKPEPDAPTPAR